MGRQQARTLFVGMGSPHGDDRLGWLVAEALKERIIGGDAANAARDLCETARTSEWKEKNAERESSSRVTTIVGPLRSQTFEPDWIVIRKATIPADLLAWLDSNDARFDRLIVCDACRASAAADLHREQPALRRWEWPAHEIAALRSAGSHALSVPQVLKLAERLGTLPPVVIIFGVEGECFDAFAEPSLSAAAFDGIVQCMADELATGNGGSADHA